jgi:hypothetical protein
VQFHWGCCAVWQGHFRTRIAARGHDLTTEKTTLSMLKLRIPEAEPDKFL